MNMKWLLNIVLVAVLGGLVALGVIRLASLLRNAPGIMARVQAQVEAARPAQLDVVVVADGTCQACTSPQPFIDALKQQQVVFVSLKQIDGTTEAGKQYVAQQNLERFPAVVVGGEVSHRPELEQFLIQAGEQNGDRFVYYVPAPYREVAEDKLRGLFRVAYLTTSSCSSCYDVTSNAVALKNLGVNVTEDEVVSAESAAGKALIQAYKIRYLPTLTLVGDLEVYPAFQNVWPQVGSREVDGTYVLRDGVKLMGTYYDLRLRRTLTPQPATLTP